VIGLMQDTIVNYAVGQRNTPHLRSWDRPNKPEPVTTEKVDRMLEAMHFLRVTGCVAWPQGNRLTELQNQLAWMLDPGGNNHASAPPLPPRIESMPLELLATRNGNAHYESFLGMLAEMEAEEVRFRAELTEPGIFYKWDWQRQQSWLTRYWSRGDLRSRLYYAGEYCGTVFDTVVYHRRRISESEYSNERAHEMLSYINQYAANGPIRTLPENVWWSLKEYNDQIESR
jgi:hypothetical protein